MKTHTLIRTLKQGVKDEKMIFGFSQISRMPRSCVYMGRRKKLHMYILLALCEFMKSHKLIYLDRKPIKRPKMCTQSL